MQVDPAISRQIQNRCWDQRPISHDRAAVRRQLAEARTESRITGRIRSEHLDVERSRKCGNRRGGKGSTTSGRGIGSGDYSDDFVRRGEQGAQRRQRNGRGSREYKTHKQPGYSQRSEMRCGEYLTSWAPSPNQSASRIAFIASLRVSASSRSMNMMPSR